MITFPYVQNLLMTEINFSIMGHYLDLGIIIITSRSRLVGIITIIKFYLNNILCH